MAGNDTAAADIKMFLLLDMVLFWLSKMKMLHMGSCCYRWLAKTLL